MKKGVFNLLIAILTIFYISTIENNSTSFLDFINSSLHSNKTEKESTINKISFSDIAAFVGEPIPFQTLANNSDHTPFSTPSYKKQFEPFWVTITISNEQKIASSFSQYQTQYPLFLIRLLKASLLFPTHYFW